VIVGLVAGRSLRDLAWGLGIGLLLALGLARPVAGMFYGVEAFDLPTFATVPLVLAVAVVFATLIPTRRALGVEPAAALRNE
jgi:putative ABC transport system permease protein